MGTNKHRKYTHHHQNVHATNQTVIMVSTLNDDEKEYLIELVRERPVLYRKGDKNFKDSRTIKPNNWKEVASAMKEKFERAATGRLGQVCI